MKVLCSIITASILITGCASMGANYKPVIDLQNADSIKYQEDLGDCQKLAKERMNAADGAIIGSIAGALLGALLAPRGYRNYVAAHGAVAGGAAGAVGANETQESIVKRCLIYRGYRVLN